MDISQISPSTVELDLRHPGTRKPLGIIFTLRSNHDPIVKSATEAFLEKSRATERRGNPLSVADMKAESVKLSAAAVENIRFTGDGEWKGGKPKFSAELAREMLALDWVRAQIDKQVQAEADFFGG